MSYTSVCKYRSYQPELLDEAVIDKKELFQNLKELETINAMLGGHNVSISGLKNIVFDNKTEYHLVDIGCGGGDNLKAISKWSKKNSLKFRLTGVDIKPDCIEYAEKNCVKFQDINFICDDFRRVFSYEKKIDVVHASLFCHHFSEQEISDFISVCNEKGCIVIINDLERNILAYTGIKYLTRAFSKSRLVKNDAPLSVQRGFKKTEWHSIMEKAGVKKYTIQNYWAFRHLVICFPGSPE